MLVSTQETMKKEFLLLLKQVLTYYVLTLQKVLLNTKRIQLLGFMKSMMAELKLVLVILLMKMASVS